MTMSQKTVLGLGSENEAVQAAAILGEMPGFDSFPLVVVEAGQWFLECHDDGALASGVLAAALANVGFAARSEAIATIPDADWVAETQKALPPGCRAGRFIVHGSHDRARGSSQWAIEIDAGDAFGTAHHATTTGCLRAIGALPPRSNRGLS